MLRGTITKVKRACALARIPRVVGGEYQVPPCNLDKISAIFTKSKSTTTSGSNDDEDEKCEKCKRLIELSFGPEMCPPDKGIENIEVAKLPELHVENITSDLSRSETICEQDNRIASGVTMSKDVDNDEDMANILEAKVDDEDTFKPKVEIIKEPSLFQSFKRNKETYLGRSTPVLLSNKDSKKQSSDNITMLEMLSKQSSDTVDNKVLNEIEKLGISQQLLKDITNNSCGNDTFPTDTSKKVTPKPGKISEIDLETRVLEKDQTKMSERSYINRRAIKHFAMHMGAEDITKNITSGANKSSEGNVKKGDHDSTNKLIDDRHYRIDHKISIVDKKIPDLEKEKTLKHVFTSNRLTDDRRINTEREVTLDSRMRPHHGILFDSEKLSEIDREKIKSENISPNILNDDRHLRTELSSPNHRETLPQIAREKVAFGNVNIKTHKEPTIETDDKTDDKEPVVLVKECQDSDCFRITPETPKAQTLTDQLVALNLKIQAATHAGRTPEVDELKEEEEILTKEYTQHKLTKQMDKIFKDDRMPRHLFSHLTVVSKNKSGKTGAGKVTEPSAFKQAKKEKMSNEQRVPPHMFHDLTVLTRNVPKEMELQKAIQNFYEQEHDPELVKPDRMQYNSPNNDIVEDRDYSLELDPRVVIREFEPKQPIETYSPQNPPQDQQSPNYYSNNFNNQGNIFPDNTQQQNMPAQNPYDMPSQNPYGMPSQNPFNMPPQNPYNMPAQNPYNSPPPFGGPQNLYFNNEMLTTATMPVANEMPSSYSKPPLTGRTDQNFNDEIQEKEIPHVNIDLPHVKIPHAASTFTTTEGKLTENISTVNMNAMKPHVKMPYAASTSTTTEGKLTENMSAVNKNATKTHMPHAVSTSTAKEGKLTENMPTVNMNATKTVTHGNTAFHLKKYSIDKSYQVHTGSQGNTNDLPNRVIESNTDIKHGNINDNLKQNIMLGMTPETARFKVRSGSLETPILNSRAKATRPAKSAKGMKLAKHYRSQSKATVSPWLDKGTVTLKPHPSTAVKETANIAIPALHPNMTLSEMLQNVRKRARLEMYQQFILTCPGRKVKPARGSCKKPKPPCPPPQKKCPSSEPKQCPPPQCPKPKPPAPKPCKPACPDPCSTPKCPPKDPCAKCEKTERGTDVLGLVVTLGPMGMSQYSAVSCKPSNVFLDNLLAEDDTPNDLLMEEMILCGALPDSISLSEFENPLFMFQNPLLEAVYDLDDDIIIPDLMHTALIFNKDYEPWTPIPSWPIPRKVAERKLVCPKEGCKVRGPPPPGARCGTIHHPCAGFPNDKKRT